MSKSAKISYLKDENGNYISPIVSSQSVYDGTTKIIPNLQTKIDSMNSRLNNLETYSDLRQGQSFVKVRYLVG